MDFVKMGWDKEGELDYNCKIKNLPPKAREFVRKKIEEVEYEALSGACDCESPIEQLMGVMLAFAFNDTSNPYPWVGSGPEVHRLEAWVDNQVWIEVHERSYRIDFVIYIKDREVCLKNNRPKIYSIAVECDGHDFHEKTKEQAAHDKMRDRDLAEVFDLVLHYTGSEIYKGTVIDDIYERIEAFFAKIGRGA
jgi:hypothetical protein